MSSETSNCLKADPWGIEKEIKSHTAELFKRITKEIRKQINKIPIKLIEYITEEIIDINNMISECTEDMNKKLAELNKTIHSMNDKFSEDLRVHKKRTNKNSGV